MEKIIQGQHEWFGGWLWMAVRRKEAHKRDEKGPLEKSKAATKEARELAREILAFYDGQGMRPDWEKKYPWLKKK